jgi:hypothetical protein
MHAIVYIAVAQMRARARSTSGVASMRATSLVAMSFVRNSGEDSKACMMISSATQANV